MLQIGTFRYFGPNHTKAAYWYRLAAHQGYVDAEIILGTLCAQGSGVPQNYTKVAYWYRLAAHQGVAEAENNLGTLYEGGPGVQKNYKKSIFLV